MILEAFDEIAAGALALGRGNILQTAMVTPASLQDSVHQNGTSSFVQRLPEPLVLNMINVEATCEFSFKMFRAEHLLRHIDGSLKGGLEIPSFITALSLLMVMI